MGGGDRLKVVQDRREAKKKREKEKKREFTKPRSFQILRFCPRMRIFLIAHEVRGERSFDYGPDSIRAIRIDPVFSSICTWNARLP